jgi:hypothetical protein
MNVVCRSVSVFVTYLIVFFMTFMLLYFLGYCNSFQWNQHAILTNATIIEHEILLRRCSERCNCHTYCSVISNGKSTYTACTTHCDTCYYDCYDGIAIAAYSPQMENRTEELTFKIVAYEGSRKNYSLDQYPLNSTISVYYHSQDHTDVSLSLKDAKGYFVGAMCVISIGSFLLVVYLTVEIVFFTKKYCQTQNLYNQRV